MNVRRLAVAGGAALILGSGFASPAAAEPVTTAAVSGTFYVYQHDDARGGWATFTANDRNFATNYWNTGGTVDNGTSSVRNHTNRHATLYQHAAPRAGANCGGDTYHSNANSVDNDLSNNGFDNKASCIVFV
ncbi:peptidase inhibitor family I36 protein [Nocardiopsis dassonvillei]|uniref:peptidase inhibitor family I36 protein n=1 Tax=Nocardiopsis dassonvillei TaxID=2014 RepID=UPI003638BAF0